MKAQTLMITAGAVVALAAPAAAGARIVPTTHATKHAKGAKVAKEKHRPPAPIYIYIPGPLVPPAPPRAGEVCAEQNAELVEHGLDPIDCSTLVRQTTSLGDSGAADQNATLDTAATDGSVDAASSLDESNDC